ncbi:protein ROOT PRIMORDIUM DEFECTIVE 1 [Sesbania bispinosa]|nr:protein ROOT PRIMORDIUM DEFECTIVE 1 [Sesbania bispinosa]
MGEMLANYFDNNGNSNEQIQLPNLNVIVPAKMGEIVGEACTDIMASDHRDVWWATWGEQASLSTSPTGHQFGPRCDKSLRRLVKVADEPGEFTLHRSPNANSVQLLHSNQRAAQSSPYDGRVLESSPSGIQVQGAGGLEAATLRREFRVQNDGLSCAVGDTSRVMEGAPMQCVALIELEEQVLHVIESHLCDVPISVVDNTS